jgi:DNA-binding NtrC family response regulator
MSNELKAEGQEVLVVDGDEKVQRGLGQLLTSNGLIPTVMADPERARSLLREKFFALALVDLDTPGTNGGLDLVRWIKREAPTVTCLVMVSRSVFESAVEAFRAGASDVVVKAPDQVEYLRRRVVETATQSAGRAQTDRLVHEVLGLHEDFLKRLMDTSRQASELEERLGGGAQSEVADLDTSVLIVEPPDDAWLGEQLRKALDQRGGYHLRVAGSGGEGLDAASGGRFQLALVCESLPDLPGSMVVNTIKSQSPETITILYTRPGARPGRASVMEGSKAIAFVPEFRDAGQMVERIDELKAAFRAKSRERRYLAAFRQQNYELLKRYAELKQKLARAAK